MGAQDIDRIVGRLYFDERAIEWIQTCYFKVGAPVTSFMMHKEVARARLLVAPETEAALYQRVKRLADAIDRIRGRANENE